jgi:hypothetical protein
MADGAQGFQGADGAQGAQGATGADGAQGFQGAQGSDGAAGFQGAQGASGNDGALGAQGFQGAQGATGATGSGGAQGFQGASGSQGFQGAQGVSGTDTPFRATLYVDPLNTGAQTGSASEPFTSIAAAIAAAPAAGAIIYLPPLSTVTENVVFPTSGNWEIACQHTGRATISGTVVCTSVAQAQFRLTNLTVTGAVTGDATSSAGNFLYLSQCRLLSTLTLTGSGSGFWFVILVGRATNFFGFGGSIHDAISVYGSIYADAWDFSSTVTFAGQTIFRNTRFSVAAITSASPVLTGVQFYECVFTVATTITGSSHGLSIALDSASMASLLTAGLILAGTATLKTVSSNMSVRGPIANNVGLTNLTARAPLGLYECSADLTILAAGTLGHAQVNVTYTNMAGATVTMPVGPALDVTGVNGPEASGTYAFSHNGSSAIQYSVTGITTPGALSLSLGVAVKKID